MFTAMALLPKGVDFLKHGSNHDDAPTLGPTQVAIKIFYKYLQKFHEKI